MDYPRKKSFAAELLEKRKKKRPSAILVIAVIVAVIAVGYALYMRFGIKEIPPETVTPPEETPIRSVAVLPLANISGDPEQEYFSDGMHDALIADLSKIRALRVISRTSVMGYRNTEKKVPEIASELGVDALIEGSVFRADGTVRIIVQLIGAFPERHLWTQIFDRNLGDVLALHSEVAQAIADEIKITVTPEEKERLSSIRTVNPEAYDLYQRGRYFARRFKGGVALDYYQQAIEKDSSFAEPYAEIAFEYATTGRIVPDSAEVWVEIAKDMIAKVLELNPSLPSVYTTHGVINLNYEWDWEAAENNFKKAIEIDPNYEDSYSQIDDLFFVMGREKEVLDLLRKALELNPRSLEITGTIIWILVYLGDYDEAFQNYLKMVEIEPNFWQTYYFAGFIFAAQGKYEEAIAAFTKMAQLQEYSGPLPSIGYVYGLMGKRAEAEKILDDYQAEYPRSVRYANMIRSGLKDFDPIFDTLENLYNEHSPNLIYQLLQCKRYCKDIVSEPRWKALMKKMGLPED